MKVGIGTYSEQERQHNDAVAQLHKAQARIDKYKSKHKYWQFRFHGVVYEATEEQLAVIKEHYESAGIAFVPDYMIERS